jgi:hypothetical protein
VISLDQFENAQASFPGSHKHEERTNVQEAYGHPIQNQKPHNPEENS